MEREKEREEIPAEIIVGEIMWRLPVKPLARFRSVCKTWNSIISSDPEFAILQLKNSSASTTGTSFHHRQRVMLWDYDDRSSAKFAFLLEKKNHQSLASNTNSEFLFSIEKVNTSPIIIKGCYPSFSWVASCDGLVCIRHEMTKSILFWNPLTGETKRVSDRAAKIPPFSDWSTYALGYDSSTDDYKLVWIHQCLDNTPNHVGVFSLRTNSWRQIEDFPIKLFGLRTRGTFMNGALYWTGYSGDWADIHFKLVSLSLETEKYRLLELDLPATFIQFQAIHFGIQVLGDKLALYYPSSVDDSHHLLLFNPSDNRESWTKHTVTIPGADWYAPLCLLENVDEILFQDFHVTAHQHRLGVYHLKDGTCRHLQILDLAKTFIATTFTESLISPNTYKGTEFIARVWESEK